MSLMMTSECMTSFEINEPVQGSSGSMGSTKKLKLQMKLRQVDVSEIMHTLWPFSYWKKAVVNLFSLTCELLQGAKLSSDKMINTVLYPTDS